MNTALALADYPVPAIRGRPTLTLIPDDANAKVRREPSSTPRRKPSLTLASCNPHRLTTSPYAGQGCPNAAGARRAGAADNADRVLTITYPDNRVATYTRDILGRITQVSFPVNGTPTVLTQDRTYRADGLLATQTSGSGLAESRTYDQQGRMTQWVIGGETRTFTYDANSNVQTRATPTESRTYVYDSEDRLTEDRITTGSGTTQTLAYDPNGNRTQLNTTAYAYAATSNRLIQVGTQALTLDPAGNTTQDHLNYNYVYYANGTLKEARAGTKLVGTYTYNHRFQRTRKVAGNATTVYHHDLEGRLIAETTNTGTLIRAYVHDDEAPIAQLTKGTTDTLVHLHPDALGTPRLATDAARSTVWRYDGNAFGDTLPNEDPDGNRKKTTINLRFPGQYYDAESGLFYNWHRYYDPRIGRYVTSDPIGLEGGLNTYAYVDNNPTGWIDPDGLTKTRGGGNTRSEPRPEQGGTTWWNGRQGSWVYGRFYPRLGEVIRVPPSTAARAQYCPIETVGRGAEYGRHRTNTEGRGDPVETFLQNARPGGPFTSGITPQGEPRITAPGVNGGTVQIRFGSNGNTRVDIVPPQPIFPETIHWGAK